MLGVIQLSDLRKADNEKNRVGESALRREIRSALREAMGEDQPIVAGAGGDKEQPADKATVVNKASSTTRGMLKKAFQMAAAEMSKREDLSDEDKEKYANLAQLDQNKELDLMLQTAADLASAIAGGDPASVAAILQRMTSTGGVASAIKRGDKRLAANAPKTESVRRKR